MSDPTVQEILRQLADSLLKEQRAIVDEWLARIVSDDQISASNVMGRTQLEDHVPELLRKLFELIAGSGQPEAAKRAESLAETHGAVRWQQGYDLAELMRELAQFRVVVFRHIFAFSIGDSEFAASARLFALEKLHFLLDDLAASSIKQFVCEQEARLRQHAQQVSEESDARLRLLRTVSHEVRNVLNAVSMAAQSLSEETDELLRNQMVGMVLRNVRHMRELLDQLLEVSALIAERRANPPERFNPAPLVQEITATYRPMAEAKGLTLESTVDPRLSFIESDELKIRQIACNLVSNALKYTETGWIRFELSVVDDGCFRIAVEDSGAGMTPIETNQIFSEFYRVKSTAHQPGVGLGLAITKQLVAVLGGRIEVHSELERGSRFEVFLPQGGRKALTSATEARA